MNPIQPAPADNRRVPTPRRPADNIDDTETLARLAGAITLDRLGRFAAVLGADVVRDLVIASAQAQVTLAAEKEWAAWTVREGVR